MTGDFLIRNASLLGGARADVSVRGGRIVEIGPALRADRRVEAVDAHGGLLIPGLHDHHLHLFAQAASGTTASLAGAMSWSDLRARLAARMAVQGPTDWVRANGYDERAAGLALKPLLDEAFPWTPVRIQDRTGALWILNAAALDRIGVADAPPGLERDGDGAPTGLLWREDIWLRERAPTSIPDVAAVSRALASAGVTGLTDASVSTTQDSAAHIADARRSGAVVQKLTLMSGGPLHPDPEGLYAVGPRKIVLDERDLPDIDHVAGRVREARAWGRTVAFHCVAASELAVALAALDGTGTVSGDRIEHAGVTPASAIAEIRRLGLTVVTQPGFIAQKGDRYLADCPQEEHIDLYRCGSFLAAGVPVAGSSDGPFGPLDPWVGIRAAVARATPSGRHVAPQERITALDALDLYLRPAVLPGLVRRVAPGAVADLCLLSGSLEAMSAGEGTVAGTWVDGVRVYPNA